MWSFHSFFHGKGFVHQNNRVESVAQVVWHRIYSIKRIVALIKFFVISVQHLFQGSGWPLFE